DVPDGRTMTLCGGSDEVRRAVVETQSRQPLLQHELVAASEPGVVSLRHEGQRSAVPVRGNTQAVHARLQALQLDRRVVRAVRQAVSEDVAKLRPSGLRGAGDRVMGVCAPASGDLVRAPHY